MINHDHDKDHDPCEPTSCSICFRYPDVHNAVQETKMVSHRKRMKLMFASTKMGWAQHHPATMTDGGCYFCILVDGTVQKLWIPSTSIHVYIIVYIYIFTYIYIHIYLYVHTRPDPKPTSIQNDSCFFFAAQTKPQKHPTFSQNPTRGCIPKAKDWHLRPIPERKFLVPDVRRSCTDDAQLASLTLTPWLDLYSGIKMIRCVACHSRRNWKMSSLVSEMAATCPKTVARINSSQNRVYACAAFAETPWHSVPSFGVVFILGQIHWTLRWYSFSLTKQPKQVLDFEACGLLDSYLSRLYLEHGKNRCLFCFNSTHHELALVRSGFGVKKVGCGSGFGVQTRFRPKDRSLQGTYKSSIEERNMIWTKPVWLCSMLIFRGYTSNSIFTPQIFLLKLASKADGFVKISPELMTRNFHGRLGTTLLQVATDWMDQINIWSNAPENHREGRARLGWFCWGFDGGGCLDDSQEYWNQRISFFYEGLLIPQGPLYCLPSRELTYPPKMAFWRWFSSQGGIC